MAGMDYKGKLRVGDKVQIVYTSIKWIATVTYVDDSALHFRFEGHNEDADYFWAEIALWDITVLRNGIEKVLDDLES